MITVLDLSLYRRFFDTVLFRTTAQFPNDSNDTRATGADLSQNQGQNQRDQDDNGHDDALCGAHPPSEPLYRVEVLSPGSGVEETVDYPCFVFHIIFVRLVLVFETERNYQD